MYYLCSDCKDSQGVCDDGTEVNCVDRVDQLVLYFDLEFDYETKLQKKNINRLRTRSYLYIYSVYMYIILDRWALI